MAWHQISVVSDAATATDISDFLSELGAFSVTFMSAESKPVYEPGIGETKIWEQTRTTALFELDASPQIIKTLLFQQFSADTVRDWHTEVLQDQIWERGWMEYFQPMQFGERLWVYLSGQEQSRPGTVSLILDPGLAFGTGTHPTTALCLEWLAEHDITGKTVIDFGCGSGILAIAAVLLGAKEGHAIDIDSQALIATQDNAQKNKVAGKIKTYLPDQFHPFQADIVIANILAKPLIKFADNISDLVRPEGQLVLSGILKEQADSVIKCYQTGFTMNGAIIQDEWCRLNGVKNKTVIIETYSWQKKPVPHSKRWVAGSFLAILLFIFQVIYFTGYPLSQNAQLRPFLSTLSSTLNYSLPTYRNLAEFTTIGSAIKRVDASNYRLQISFINHADFTQQLPDILVSLHNLYGGQFTKRVFSPQEYLDKDNTQMLIESSATADIEFSIAVPEQDIGGYSIELR